MIAKVLEATMLILFGISWPFNLMKSIRSKSTKGKSLLFLILIDLGYVAGITSKFFSKTFVWETDWWIFAIYVTNFLFVTADLMMYFINKKRENATVNCAGQYYRLFYQTIIFADLCQNKGNLSRRNSAQQHL